MLRFLAVSCLLCVHFVVVAKLTNINLVTIDNDPPFVYVEDNLPKGLLIELVDEVAKALPNYRITYTQLPWTDIEKQNIPANIDGFLGSYFRGNEWSNVYPYSYPIYHEQMCIVCSSSTNPQALNLRWPQDYNDTKLGTVRNFSGWLTMGVEARTLGTLNIFEFPNPYLALQGIHNGVVDCALFEKTIYPLRS